MSGQYWRHIDRIGQVALVTGGSQGIGRATVVELAGRGMRVAALARDAARLRQSLTTLPDDVRGRVLPVSGDVRDEESVRAAVAEAATHFGRIDVLVNSAGVSMNARRRLEDTTTEEWQHLLETNLTGTYLMCRESLPHLKAQGGYVLNVLSTGAFRAQAGTSLYAATKFGARALTEALVEEFRDAQVRASSVSPGPVDTTIWNHKLEPPSEQDRARMLRPEDIAEIFVWLLDRPAHLHIPDITVTPWTGI